MDGCQEARNAITIVEVPCPNCRGSMEFFIKDGFLAVDALCDWALQREDVESVLAETERKNRPSQNVLRRCRFVLEHEGPTLWWRRKK